MKIFLNIEMGVVFVIVVVLVTRVQSEESNLANIHEVLNMIKELKTDSSSTIQSVQENSGFLELSGTVDRSSGGVTNSSQLEALMHFWLSEDAFAFMPSGFKQTLQRSFVEALLSDWAHFQKQRFQISYQDGLGSMLMFDLLLVNSSYSKLMLTARFRPAPKFLILRDSDCNLLSCTTNDRVVYLPPTLTDAHLATVANMFVQMLSICQGFH